MSPRCVCRVLAVGIASAMILLAPPSIRAQGRGNAAPARTAQQAAPIDLTGYWVSFVTEDWRFRMVTPAKGDYARVPLSPEGRKIADSWNPMADETAGNQCKAFGAANIMRVPGRFHITWQDATTLRVDADAGTQTRVLHFTASPPSAERTWQGDSTASWDPAARTLKVVTTNLRPGYLRFNGVPYSERTTLTEYFDLAPHGEGGQLLVLTTIVDDPQYSGRIIVSSHFKKESDGSKWSPMPCTARW